jgi:NSS family neurotransmitter:Na+ symporter
LGFILAAAGSAVGLGNIWRFPYTTGQNGGGWFVLIYLACVAVIGIPIMMSEIMIGRAAQKQPVAAFQELSGKQTPWAGVGWLGVIAGFVILSYYIVVAGWAMDYTLKSFVNVTGAIRTEADQIGATHRATGDLGEMKRTLVLRRAEKESRNERVVLRQDVPPSTWRDYEVYAAALADATVPDVAMIDMRREVWDDTDRAVINELDLASEVDAEVDDTTRARYDTARARLLEKEDFDSRIPAAEEVQRRLEETRRAAILEAVEHYALVTESVIRDEAEDLARRNHIRNRVAGAFGSVAGDGWTSLFWTVLFMMLTMLIVAGGISAGIERACVILMPALFVLIITLVIYGTFTSGFGEAFAFVFKPDASRLQPSGVLAAMGQSFFSLSLGIGAMITYGSYQRTKDGLAGQSVTIAGLDTLVALLACGMIFPFVFSYDQEPSAGPGLVFMSMPLAFVEIGRAGMLVGAIFFGLLVFAAITSSISVLEVVASYFIDKHGWSRRKSVWIVGGAILLFGLPSAFGGDPGFAMNGWLASYGSGFDFLSTMDYLASNWMLPIGGCLIAIYAGWIMPRRLREAEVTDMPRALYVGWLILVRFVAPAVVILVLMQSIGILDADELLHGLLN